MWPDGDSERDPVTDRAMREACRDEMTSIFVDRFKTYDVPPLDDVFWGVPVEWLMGFRRAAWYYMTDQDELRKVLTAVNKKIKERLNE